MHSNVEIMNILQKENQLIDEFNMFEDWMEKYEYIIDLGKDLESLEDSLKTEDRLIEGCQSKVWIHAECIDNKMIFKADSEAIITKGIIALLIRVFNNESPRDIIKADLRFIEVIGLKEHLSPTRSNGLLGMVQRLKIESLSNIKD